MHYAIDGSNVLLGLRIDKKPSTRLLARLLVALALDGVEYRLFFDHSIERRMSILGLEAEWSALKHALPLAGVDTTFAPRADVPIEAFCRDTGAWLINSSDKLDSWNTRPKVIHRARVRRSKDRLEIVLIDDSTGTTVRRFSAHEPFTFGNQTFQHVDAKTTTLDAFIAPDSKYTEVAAEGTLLVLALDASGSMNETKSYDGRPKHEHLNEIVKSVIRRLKHARISEGLYVAILRFESDVSPLPSPVGSGFASIHDWDASLDDFDYLQGVTMRQTNIRLALQRAKELVQDALVDEETTRALADRWRAVVVLITDGRHVVPRPDGSGVMETDDDVAGQALEIHQGLSGVINERIDVGCVGIGTDLNHELLESIASPCTPLQQRMANNAKIAHLLRGGRLFVVVDAKDSGFAEAVRNFIDVASASQ